MITSISNPRMKRIAQLNSKAKLRKKEGLFIIEGTRMFQETPPAYIEEIYVSESFFEKKGEGFLKGFQYEIVNDKVFQSISDTKTPQGILCVVRQLDYQIEQMVSSANTILLLLENLQDPGNLGTILRTGEGAGISGVVMSKDCADIYNSKVIRSTMGSIYRVPFVYVDDLEQTADWLKAKGVAVYAAHLDGKMNYDHADYSGASAFLIGNEGNGLSRELSQKADTYIRIPMEGMVESLNAAIAASILMYEVYRQRR